MVTKEVQDQVWSSLPEFFRNKTRYTYAYAKECGGEPYWKGVKEQLEELFGKKCLSPDYKVGDTVIFDNKFLGEIMEVHTNYAKVKIGNTTYRYTYDSFKKVNPE